ESGVVRDGDAGPHLDADLEETVRHPQRVRVGAQRPQELAADREQLGAQRTRHVTGQTVRPARSSRFAYTPAIRSSATMPTPPGSRSRSRAGQGLRTSMRRNRKKAAIAVPSVKGSRR